MAVDSKTLLQSSLLAGVLTPAIQWKGGRSVLCLNAVTYPGAPNQLVLKMQMPSGSSIVVASTFVADQLFAFDAPPGSYFLHNLSGSAVVGVNAVLSSMS